MLQLKLSFEAKSELHVNLVTHTIDQLLYVKYGLYMFPDQVHHHELYLQLNHMLYMDVFVSLQMLKYLQNLHFFKRIKK